MRISGLAAAVVAAAALVLCSAVGAQVFNGPNRVGDVLINFVVSHNYNVPWEADVTLTHTGLDLAAPAGNRVFALKAGTVRRINSLGNDRRSGQSWGRYIVIANSDGTANGYLHIDPLVTEGQSIEKGQAIGTIFRNHLHLNACPEVAGCQHGAFPNPTFKQDFARHYLRPQTRIR